MRLGIWNQQYLRWLNYKIYIIFSQEREWCSLIRLEMLVMIAIPRDSVMNIAMTYPALTLAHMGNEILRNLTLW